MVSLFSVRKKKEERIEKLLGLDGIPNARLYFKGEKGNLLLEADKSKLLSENS